MSKEIYLCKILGDGQSPTTAYRVALTDVHDPADPNGPHPFRIQSVIGNDPNTGAPLYPWALCIAESNRHSLTRNNADIDAMPQPALRAVALSSISLSVRAQMFSAIVGRGLDLSNFNLASSYDELLAHMIQLHQPNFPIEDFDVPS